MEITNIPAEPHVVEDWDFVSINGFLLPLTIDPTLGEYCKFEPGGSVAVIHQVAKESIIGPDSKTQPEDTTIILSNILFVRKRLRSAQEPTIDQKEEWKQMLRKMAGTASHSTN